MSVRARTHKFMSLPKGAKLAMLSVIEEKILKDVVGYAVSMNTEVYTGKKPDGGLHCFFKCQWCKSKIASFKIGSVLLSSDLIIDGAMLEHYRETVIKEVLRHYSVCKPLLKNEITPRIIRLCEESTEKVGVNHISY